MSEGLTLEALVSSERRKKCFSISCSILNNRDRGLFEDAVKKEECKMRPFFILFKINIVFLAQGWVPTDPLKVFFWLS